MTSPAPQPTCIHEGKRFRILYLSESEYKGPVIIKVIKTESPSAQDLIHINNEYEQTRDLAIDGIRRAIARTSMDNRPALVMEYVSGQTLKLLFAGRKTPLSNFLRVGISVAHTLGELHEQHIVHKKINSTNILVNPETYATTIIDFSLASRLDLHIHHFAGTEYSTASLAYISPEQTGRMNRSVDYRTDLYSLGVTFYEMLTGRTPFLNNDPLSMVHAHMAAIPPEITSLNPSVPPLISDIVMKLLAKNAEDRYQSAFGLKIDLELFLAAMKETDEPGSLANIRFDLGKDDYSGQLKIPQKLYGRESELSLLLDAFDRTAAGSRELMTVSGYAGVGKTSLVAELYKPVTGKRGYFISGKYDQYQTNTPYSAFTHAFNQLAEFLLVETDTILQRWRDKILTALGGNGAVLTEVMPSLEKVIGVQPAVPRLGGEENRNRFNLTFRNFLRAVSSAEHPLVVFIDDCQWADPASLGLLKSLFTNNTIPFVLMIMAYRDNEMDQTHPFRTTLNELEAGGARMSAVSLDNLTPDDLDLLVRDALPRSSGDSHTLTRLVFEKTQGNAFFTRQFLHNLYDENMLTFNTEIRKWTWDIGQITALQTTDNVIELMAGRLKKLPSETSKLLQLAACIGNEFDLETLALINRKTVPVTLKSLMAALTQGFVIPLNDFYKSPDTASRSRFLFLHDRVQQAAYAQISEHKRQEVHLKIGRLLKEALPAEGKEKRIIEIVQHYAHAGPLFTDEKERLSVAEFNLQAAELAFDTAAFSSAKIYLETARELLPVDGWTGMYDTMLQLHSRLATAYSLTGDFDLLKRISHTIETHARCVADTVRVKQAKIQALLSGGTYTEAIDLGLKIIEDLGVSINRDPSPEEAFNYLRETAEWLTEKRIQSIPDLPDAPLEAGLIMETAVSINGPVFNTNVNLSFVFVSRIMRLCLEQGLSPWSPVTIATSALLINAALHDISKVRLMTDITERLYRDKFHQDILVPYLGVAIGGFIMQRYTHLRQTLPVLDDGVQKGLSTGAFQFAAYCSWWHAWHTLHTGIPLEKAASDCNHAVDICRTVKMERLRDWSLMLHQVALNLLGKSETPWILNGEAYDENEMIRLTLQLNDYVEIIRILFNKSWLCYLFGRTEQAAATLRDAEEYLPYAAGMYYTPLFYFYDTLANTALFDTQSAEERPGTLDRINRNLEQIEVWGRFAPMNHRHKMDLMEAEKARIEGRYWDALTSYEKAIRGARENDFPHEEALAFERAAEFYLSRGLDDTARLYLSRAIDGYTRWQAWAKVEDLEDRHRSWFTEPVQLPRTDRPPDREAGLSGLDLQSVMNVSQLISGQIVLEDLLRKLMEIVMKNAGAQKGCLILSKEGKWVIEAEGSSDTNEMLILQSIDIEESDTVSPSVVRYVERSHKSVVLDDAARKGLFINDPYIINNKIKSVLCTPLLNMGRLGGILYLENNLVSNTFTPERTELLELLAGQAAIALENALLYRQAHHEIDERKAAEKALRISEQRLQNKNEELEATNEELNAALEELEATNEALLESSNELAESEEKYRTIIENMQDVFYRTDLNGTILMLSPSFLQLVGYDSIEECLGKNIAEEFYENPDDRMVFIDALQSHGKVTNYEVKLIRRDGTPLHITTSSQFFRDRSGAIMGVEGIFRDITPQKNAETQREAALEALRQANIIVENSPVVLFRWGTSEGWPIEMVSNNIIQFGYTAEELLDNVVNYSSIIYPEDLDRIAREVRDYSAGSPDSFTQEYRILTKDGNVRWVEDRTVIERDADGQILNYQGIVIDITERKQIEIALEKRVMALTLPMDAAGEISFEDLFDLSDIQHLQDLYAEAFGVAALITHPDGTPITEPSNFTEFCGQIIRKTPKGMKNCMHSDAMIGHHNPSGPNVEPCLSAGLCNAGVSITVGGRHIANWLIGQVRDKNQKVEDIIGYAHEIGADEAAFRAAYHKIPVMSEEQFQKAAQVIFTIANQLSTSAYQNVQQARFIADRKTAEAQREEALKKHRESEQRFSTIFDSVNDTILVQDPATGDILDINAMMYTMYGYTREEAFQFSIGDISSGEPPYTRDDALAWIRKTMKNGPQIFEWQAKHRDGHLFWVEVSMKTAVIGGQDRILTVVRDISERKRMDAALRESEIRYRTVVDSQVDLISRYRPDTTLTFVNDAYCRFFGKTREELIGQSYVFMIAPEYRDIVRQETEELSKNPRQIVGEYLNYRYDGKECWIQWIVQCIIDDKGRVVEMQAVGHDVTERKQAEEALRRSEERYRVLSDYYRDLNTIFITFTEATDMEGLFKIIADQYRKFTGALGSISTLYEKSDSSLKIAAVSGDPEIIKRVESALGVQLHGLRIPVSSDLNDLMMSEVIKRSDNLAELTTDAFSQDISGRIFEAAGVTEAVALAIHYGSDLVGTAMAFLADNGIPLPNDTLTTFGHMAGLAVTRKKAEEEIINLNLELEQKVLERTRELTKAYDDMMMTNWNLENAMRELKDTQNQLVQSEKLAALGQLIAGIAHEMNTPLGAIISSNRSMIDIMQRKIPETLELFNKLEHNELNVFMLLMMAGMEKSSVIESPPGRKIKKKIASILRDAGIEDHTATAELAVDAGVYGLGEQLADLLKTGKRNEMLSSIAGISSARRLSEIIALASEKLSHVVGALQNYLKPDADKELTSVDIQKEIDIILTLLYNKIKPGVTVTKKYGNTGPVTGDRHRLNQLWMNLLNNALQAIDYNGSIEIETERKEGWIVVSVTDSGPGIPKEVRERIFEPFFTTKKHGEGMGLGLDISRKIAENQGGRIEFDSVPGRTTFSVWLKA